MLLYSTTAEFQEGQLDVFRKRFFCLSRYINDIKQTFSRIYNRKKNRRVTLWGERFKSVIAEKGETLINCLAYFDLNAFRAGIVKWPEDYRWCSIGYHVQTGNRDEFHSLDFGRVEFGVDNAQRLKKYRDDLYHAGAVKKRGKVIISQKVLDEQNRNDFQLDQIRRFCYRTRYFTDSGIMGFKSFMLATYEVFKDRLYGIRKRVSKQIKGLDGMYSMKRLRKA